MTADDLIPPDKYELILAVHNALVVHRGIERTVQYLRVQGHEWGTHEESCRDLLKKLSDLSEDEY